MTSKAPRVALALALLVPALAACGGGASAAHESCMGVASSEAARIDNVDPSTFEGDYELMGLCDELVGAYPDDEGRVVHAVGCVADYVGDNISDGVFEMAYQDGTSVPALMNDPFSIGACV